jgi:hypothetical protein
LRGRLAAALATLGLTGVGHAGGLPTALACKGGRGGRVDALGNHPVQLRAVECRGLEIALVDAAHAGGFGDAPLPRLAAHQHAHVGGAVLDAGIGQAHVVDAHVTGHVLRHSQLVPQPLLRRDHHGGVALQGRDLGCIEGGLGEHVHSGLVDDGRQLCRACTR